MKSFSCLSLVALLTCAFAVQVQEQLTPTTRVVELLKGLSKQVEEEGEKEEDLYETYVCWAKSIIAQKTASNEEAKSKIDSLETYLSDLLSGRVELTSERADLEKDIAELMSDLESAKAMREKEAEDFAEAEKEMKQALKGLDSAIKVLDGATKDHKEGVLLAVRSEMHNGIRGLMTQQENLKNAVKLGEKFLDKADALFLRRVLLGDVPDVDWKKLNRKATFKMSYKARSFKIQDVLKKMHGTFESNLKDATDKENKAIKDYLALKKSKSDQLDEAQTALTKMDGENGARGMSQSDTEDELSSLKTQVKNDVKFIGETEAALEAKKGEWKKRSALRAGELGALSKAIEILYNDDARDLFKKSFASQEGFVQKSSKAVSFMQVGASSRKAAKDASQALKTAALKSGDNRLMNLANLMAAGPSVKVKFGPVLAAIEKMIRTLKSDEASDLSIKEKCEDNRMEDTRTAIVASREMDDMTDVIEKLTSEMEKLAEEIEALLKEKAEVKAELKKATEIRGEENAEWKKTDADDQKAAETVESAKEVLTKFYADNNLMLVQKKAPESVAGEAPPPPPPTWGGDYGGKTGESTGIISIMEMVKEDILKDKATAKKEEEDAESEFQEFKKDSEKQMQDLQDDADDKDEIKGKKSEEKEETIKKRDGKSLSLKAVMSAMEGESPNCEYFAVNYVLRAKNRAIEMDGLLKAKAILKGGEFSAGPDPDREIKPGDAFLQKKRA